MAAVSNYIPPARFNTVSPFEGPVRFVDRLKHDPVLQIMADIGKQSQSETRKPLKSSASRLHNLKAKGHLIEQAIVRQAAAREQITSQFRRPDVPLRPSLSLNYPDLSDRTQK